MRKNVFLSVMLFAVLTACNLSSDKANKVMDLAEYYLESRPDTALMILENMPDPESFRGEKQARFALLAVQAMHKNYYDLDSDSLIFLALSYYQDRDEVIPKAKAHLYYGHYLFEQEMYEDAQEHFLKTIEILENRSDAHKILGMAYESVGRMNNRYNSYLDSRPYLYKSLQCFTKVNDSVCICNANINLGLNYLHTENLDSAFYYYMRAQDLADLIDYPKMDRIYQNLGFYYRAVGDYDNAEYNFLKAIEHEENDDYYNSLANVYWRKRDFEKAKMYLTKGLQSQKADIQAESNYMLFDIAKKDGNYEEAIRALELCNDLKAEYYINTDENQKKTIELSRNFLQARFDKVNLKNKNGMKNLIIAIIIIVSLGAIIGVYFFEKFRNNRKRMKEMQDEYNNNLKEIAQYKGLLAHYEYQNDLLKKNNEKEINDLNARIDLLSEQNNNLQLRMKNQGKIDSIEQNSEINQFVNGFLVYYNLVKISSRYKIDGQDEVDFLLFLNFILNDFITRLKKESDIKLTNHEIELACFIRLGYSNERIGVFFNSKSESISRAKTRLKTRLNLPVDVALDNYLRLF